MTLDARHPLRIGACLSLSGKFARFGRQAAHALEAWKRLHAFPVDLIVEDDQSDPAVLTQTMPRVAVGSDIMLGPYSTRLVRTAGRLAAEKGWLLWNHGGSGDDVEAAHPGLVISVLTPTSRYAEPFVRHLAEDAQTGILWIARGKGAFARQVAVGAQDIAHRLGLQVAQVGPGETLPTVDHSGPWALFSVGQFEDDVQVVKDALNLPHPPLTIGCVAAGVRDFADSIESPEGIYGVAQWAPHSGRPIDVGPAEDAFISSYTDLAGTHPDYPAVQTAAAAAMATHCAQTANSTRPDRVWAAAASLDTHTLFGGFRIDPKTGVQIKHSMVLMRWNSIHQLLPA